MSKLKVQAPVVHLPSFTEYQIDANRISKLIFDLGLHVPFGLWQFWYYYTDMDGWLKVLPDLMFKSNLYLADKFDCDGYAVKAYITCRERYGLNTLAVVTGESDAGYHAFNMFFTGTEWLLWEPNDGFSFSGSPFPIGMNNYKPDKVLI